MGGEDVSSMQAMLLKLAEVVLWERVSALQQESCKVVNLRILSAILVMSDGQSVDKGDAKLILGNPQQDLPTNVRIFTFGYGCDHSSCLADLANAGNGKVFSVHDIIYFPAPLADCLGSIVGVAFQKLSMHVSTAAGATMPDIHVPKTWHDDDGCIHTEVGALPNRLKHDILFDVLLSPQKVGLQFLTVA